MAKKPKVNLDNPDAWGTSGSVVLLRILVDSLYDAADLLKKQYKDGALDPERTLSHVKKIEIHLKALKDHAENPTKHN